MKAELLETMYPDRRRGGFAALAPEERDPASYTAQFDGIVAQMKRTAAFSNRVAQEAALDNERFAAKVSAVAQGLLDRAEVVVIPPTYSMGADDVETLHDAWLHAEPASRPSVSPWRRYTSLSVGIEQSRPPIETFDFHQTDREGQGAMEARMDAWNDAYSGGTEVSAWSEPLPDDPDEIERLLKVFEAELPAPENSAAFAYDNNISYMGNHWTVASDARPPYLNMGPNPHPVQ